LKRKRARARGFKYVKCHLCGKISIGINNRKDHICYDCRIIKAGSSYRYMLKSKRLEKKYAL